jgi:hypothetical protein
VITGEIPKSFSARGEGAQRRMRGGQRERRP